MIRGNYIFLRLPLDNKLCIHGHSYSCGFGTCDLDGSDHNMAECPTKCDKFKPSFYQRFKLALKILFWCDAE